MPASHSAHEHLDLAGERRPPVTRNAANAASGDGAIIGGAYGTASGYIVVVAYGHFTGYDAVTPPGDNNYPTATVMVMVANATTGEVTDAGLQNTTPDMSKVGPVTTIASY